MKHFSTIIIGAGPAGYTASIYLSRYKVDNVVIGAMPGGDGALSQDIGNYPSEIAIKGPELMQKMLDSVKHWGGEFVMDKVIEIKKDGDKFWAKTQLNGEFTADTLLIASGSKYRALGLDREEELVGKGVTYCATCDGMFFKDKVVAVVGGGDSATTASLYLADIAKQVYQIHRRDQLRGEQIWIEKVLAHPKITMLWDTQVTALVGEPLLEKLVLDNPYEGSNELAVNGVFIEIGSIPNTDLYKEFNLDLDETGHIQVTANQSASAPGVWAAGDISTGSNKFRQIVTACSEGSIAADSIYHYVSKLK